MNKLFQVSRVTHPFGSLLRTDLMILSLNCRCGCEGGEDELRAGAVMAQTPLLNILLALWA